MDKIGNGPIVGETARDYLENRRYTDYYDYKKKLLRWLQTMGKNPEKAEGYADSTLANVTYKVDLFNVWNWKETGHYSTRLTTDRADAHMMHLVMEGDRYSDTYKDIVQKCLKRVFKYQNHVEGFVECLVNVVANCSEIVPQVALGDNGNVVEVRIPGEIFVTILLKLGGVLLFELVGDGFVVDEWEDEFLVVGWVNGVSDYIGAFEQVTFEIIQREGHTQSVLWWCLIFCGGRLISQ